MEQAPAPETSRTATTQPQPELTERLASASLWSFLVYVGGAGLTCLAQLIIARTIGAASYGIYSYVLAWMTLLAYVATLGFNTVLLRFVPAYSSKEQWSLARGVIQYAFGRSLLVGIAIALFGIAIVWSLARQSRHEMTVSLSIGMAIIPVVALYVLGSAAVRALGGVISAIAPERLVRDSVSIALVLLAAALSTTSVGAPTILMALMAGSAVTAGMVGLSLRKLWPPQLRSVEPAYAPEQWWHLAIPIMIMIGVEVLMSRAGVMLLGWIGDTHAAGIFALGLNLALVLVLPRVAVGTFFSPNVSKLHAHQNDAELQSLFARATVLSLAGTTALALPLLLLTEPLLRFFGEEFAATVPIDWSATKPLDDDGTRTGSSNDHGDRSDHQRRRVCDRHCRFWSNRRGSSDSRDERDLEHGNGNLHLQTRKRDCRSALCGCGVPQAGCRQIDRGIWIDRTKS